MAGLLNCVSYSYYIRRLNALVGTQNFDVDDNRSDLTDPYKPTKLAEDYRAIFDKEWEIAYEELEVVLDEPSILIYLGKVTWVCILYSNI